MQFSANFLARNGSQLQFVKRPAVDAPPAQQDAAVVATVTEMLGEIERDGLNAVREYAARLDGWTGSDFLIEGEQLAQSGQRLPSDLRSAIEVGSRRTRAFARAYRAK